MHMAKSIQPKPLHRKSYERFVHTVTSEDLKITWQKVSS